MKKEPEPVSGLDGIPIAAQRKLTEAEFDSLLVHVLKCPGFFEEAIPYLSMKGIRDRGAELIVQACKELVAKHGDDVTGDGFPERFKHELRLVAELDRSGTDRELVAKMCSPNGRVAAAFALDPNELQIDDARALLMQWFNEFEVVGELEQIVHDLGNGGSVPANLEEIVGHLIQRSHDLQNVTDSAITTMADDWDEHQQRLEQFRGKELIGLRTGLPQLDQRTLGLRGLMFLCAQPGAGKTTLSAVQIALGVCTHAAENDCVVIILSLDMSRFDLYRRINCNLADLDWRFLMFGSSERSRDVGSHFSMADEAQLHAANKLLRDKGIGERVLILDREIIGDSINARSLATLIRRMKDRVGAKRALLIVDYAQLLPVPDEITKRGDLAVDRHQIRTVQQVLELTRTKDDPIGDVALVISEARKSPASKGKESKPWADSMSDLMGSARLSYSADAVLLYGEMNDTDLGKYYVANAMARTNPRQHREDLLKDGIVPITLNLVKARDGMRRGRWGAEFHFRTSQFVELPDPNTFGASNSPSGFHLVPPADDPPLPPDGPGHAAKPKKAMAKAATATKAKAASASKAKPSKCAPKKSSKAKPR